ncbi:MAG: ABC transporter permease, partial [Vicinamibacteria bacterium]
LKSFHALQGVERGYREEGVYYTSVELPFRKYEESHRRAAFFHDLLERVRLAPGVDRASISLGLPLDPRAEFFVTRSPYSVEGKPEPPSGLAPEAALHVVGPDLFETLGVSLLSGRGFDSRDIAGGPGVVVVNQSFAESAWPGEDPIGKHLKHDLTLLPDEENGARRVVGVVSDFRYYALEREPEAQMYVPHAQSPWPQMHLLIRASSDPAALDTAVRDALREMDPEVPLLPLRELVEVAKGVMAPARARAGLLASFAAAASFSPPSVSME